jgi:tetratricopeptide (TPR) repeat protein
LTASPGATSTATPRGPGQRPGRAGPLAFAWPLLLLALVLPTAAWVLFEAQRSFRADWASAAERQQVLAWVSGAGLPGSAQEWQAARAALQASLDLAADDPDMQERMGDLHAVAGLRDWADSALRQRHYADAAAYYQVALKLRPSAPQTWAMLASARQAMGAPAAGVHEAWAKARQLGPFEGHVQPILMQIVLTDWNGASPPMQAWAKDLFDTGNEATRRDINALALRYGLQFTPDLPAAPPTR